MIQVFISCDGEDCHQETDTENVSVDATLEIAHEKKGWKTIKYTDRDYHYCKVCANEDN